MNSPGHQFLTTAAGPQYHHRRVGRGHIVNHVEQALHLERLAQDAVVTLGQLERLFKGFYLLLLADCIRDIGQSLHGPNYIATVVFQHFGILQDIDRPALLVGYQTLFLFHILGHEQLAKLVGDGCPQ